MAAAFLFVLFVLVVTAYALVRPFYLGYRRPHGTPFRPPRLTMRTVRRTIDLQPWPYAERPRVLIEHADQSAGLELAGALRGAGFAVAICRGPDGTARCPVHKLEPCALVEGADVVVTALDFGREGRDVLEGLRTRYPDTPLVVEATAAESIELANVLYG